ncbi:D-alanyl-D-alanine carboxypeptidase/D-alanyl-D-alanine-endopeptidase [Pseudozobellia thermophila]|uniref:D-alanyl-D-alanine carboxypeptidase / D-alanyl-D-alanine-endopeptidase (Penicillin-binding protein 4) n=1 Tax=Pseudozobellia thermophila TaxID=192903 RepID=A0A1M6FNW6_9FLAO|nr:D-alanyl-D-alanine carboxypeptidase [Pseudozobellia thermophila]SHI99299.1 D-alanyl-D-alanine carboxypeptidase / D-alanyl-D-alanine-endopeptidase (penicillin-binding protein 4) [Pseudozobellia thermophila]
MIRFLFAFILALVLTGCAGGSRIVKKNTESILGSSFYQNQFTGFVLFDPGSGDTLVSYNGQKYFTPASNTKIFTLYAALHMLPDSIPALKYVFENDTLFIEGTGNPTLLHPYFEDKGLMRFLKSQAHIALFLDNLEDEKYGPGWSWGDYQYYYQAERSSLPLYGNVLTLRNDQGLQASPIYFKDSVVMVRTSKNREIERNIFYFDPSRQDTLEIPYRGSKELTRHLLERELGKELRLVDKMPIGEKKVFYGIASDTVYKRMMHQSDNFLAEQLLILASSTLSDTLSSERAREHVLGTLLPGLRQEPRWVDGSGLSRYNLFTPESMVHVLHRMYLEVPRAQLFGYFPIGGESGTLKNWYPGDPEPYIYAKTGSLGNNHCLSGYLITKSGKTLIFSFMNNHFRHPSSEVKKRMQSILEKVRDTY